MFATNASKKLDRKYYFTRMIFQLRFVCSSMIDDRPLRFRGEVYHPYHFNCSSCGIELNADAREVKSRPGFTANEMVT